MLKLILPVFFCVLGALSALPSNPILRKTDTPRYQYVEDQNGETQLVDLWMSLEDLAEAARYDPDSSNRYHLFTRKNPSVSQPLLPNSQSLLAQSNFDSAKKTFVLIHGWNGSPNSEFNAVVVPALVAAVDCNVIVVDWTPGSSSIIYRLVIERTISSGRAVARFIDWLNEATGATPLQYHIIGHGFGGHQAGIVGRNVKGRIAYITGLNPALVGWASRLDDRFQRDDAIYTEVIHTNHIYGYLEDIAQADFYPNAGISMPGCDSNRCDDARSYFYFAESITAGGFEAKQCVSYATAVTSLCSLLPGRLNMGGLTPKSGSRGVYWLDTNPAPPFSKPLDP